MEKKALFSAIEMPIVLILFAGSILYLGTIFSIESSDYKYSVESALSSIYYDQRTLIMQDDLSQTTVSGDWSLVTSVLNRMFADYELILSNSSVSKTIVSCTPDEGGRYYDEIIIAIENNNNYEFRKLMLGVCY